MENTLRAYRFQSPTEIPVSVSVEETCWASYDKKELLQVLEKHKQIIPNFEGIAAFAENPVYLPWKRKGVPYVDSWGCRWLSEIDGWTGIVQEPSLASWDSFKGFQPPSYKNQNGWGKQDWLAFSQSMKSRKATGQACMGSLRHGHTFLTLTYMRGFENAIYDMYDEEPNLEKLLAMLQKFNLDLVNQFLTYEEIDIIGYPEDLGTQNNCLISPGLFRKYIKPVYRELMRPAREKDKLVYMHSDGRILDLMDDLIDAGVDVINLQDLVNGINAIREQVKGRVAIDLDIDRQTVVPMGSEKDIDDLVREAVTKLYDKRGGLAIKLILEPPTPIKNIDAVLSALEKYKTYKEP